MNHRRNGFLLFEFLITSLLASTLLIIIYQSYRTANTGVQYIKNHADFQMQKILLQYQIELDSMHIFIPDFIYDLYPKINKYLDNEKKDNKSEDYTKKKLDQECKLASIFFPELSHTPEEIKISWISSRKILGKSSFVKINYIIKLTEKTYKEKKLYRLYRREDTLEKDYSIKKIGNEYTFITYIANPEIHFIMPKIVINQEKPNNNKFFTWSENPLFIAEEKTTEINLKNMNKKPIIPFTLLINGIMVAYNFSKELDLEINTNFPIADYALQILLNNDTEKTPINTNNENKDKKTTDSFAVKPINQNTLE
jgi:hypothetical protein